MPNNFVASFFNPTFRVTYTDGSQSERLTAAAKVKAYDDEFKRQAEQKAGRPLSTRELLHGLEPREDRETRQKIEDANWRPKLVPQNGGTFSTIIESARKELDRVDTRQTPEARLARFERWQREVDESLALEHGKRDWLADPFRAKALAELNELDASHKYTGDRTASEVEAIRKAREQLQTVDADMVEARRLLKVVFDAEDNRKQSLRESAQAQIDAAQSRLDALKGGRLPKVSPIDSGTLTDKMDSLFHKMYQAGYKVGDLNNVMDARDSGDVKRMEWALAEYSEQPAAEPPLTVETEGAADAM